MITYNNITNLHYNPCIIVNLGKLEGPTREYDRDLDRNISKIFCNNEQIIYVVFDNQGKVIYSLSNNQAFH